MLVLGLVELPIGIWAMRRPGRIVALLVTLAGAWAVVADLPVLQRSSWAAAACEADRNRPQLVETCGLVRRRCSPSRLQIAIANGSRSREDQMTQTASAIIRIDQNG